ncbi:MAG TPA: hypothetical protein VFQ30_07985 [Ktedonobacteraceae bacterium]|nr:hypothetical protein [Ktedonobacteraceae bacterium]
MTIDLLREEHNVPVFPLLEKKEDARAVLATQGDKQHAFPCVAAPLDVSPSVILAKCADNKGREMRV